MSERLEDIAHKMVQSGKGILAADESIEQRGYARVADIARILDITRGSVSVAMQSLKAGGYVEQDESHFFKIGRASCRERV